MAMRDDPVILTGAGILLIGGIIAAYPIVLLPIALAAGLWFLTAQGKHAHQAHLTRAAEHRTIAARADREHALVMQGNLAGVYGNYPPATAA